ncbi:hypothetical protein XAR_3554 [Xanthomonas citri pv. glycines str. 8ra]|nr:hypothetical protein XAR_3554 [Xanthomonas citri pv. glycines str. 8ra]
MTPSITTTRWCGSALSVLYRSENSARRRRTFTGCMRLTGMNQILQAKRYSTGLQRASLHIMY